VQLSLFIYIYFSKKCPFSVYGAADPNSKKGKPKGKPKGKRKKERKLLHVP